MPKNKRKVYIVGGYGDEYANWTESVLVDKMEDADLVLGTGGSDWSPEYYYTGNRPHPELGNNPARDAEEILEFKRAFDLGKKILGVCRSAQAASPFFNYIHGGMRAKIIQHQENPNFIHKIKTYNDLEVYATSTHHNALSLDNLVEGKEYKLLAWTENMLKYKYLDANTQSENPKEVEIAYFPSLNFLAYQPHFEMIYKDTRFSKSIDFARDTLNKFMDNEL